MIATKSVWVLVLVVVIAFVGVFVWFAATRLGRPGGSDVTVGSASRIEKDLAVVGRSVVVDTELQGDLAAAAARVIVNQRVRGYVLTAGSQVEIGGPVDNDLWAAGGNVRVRAPVSDHAWLAGGSVVIEPEASIGSDAMIAGNTVDVLGQIGGDLNVAAERVTLSSEVRGTVRAQTSRLRVQPGAIIHGDLIVKGRHAAEIAPEAKVLGTVRHNRPAGPQWNLIGWLGRWIFIFLALLILGAVALALGNPWVVRVGERIARQPAQTLLAGFCTVVLAPLLILLAGITAIGIPLALVLAGLLLAAGMSAGVFVSYWIGGYIPRKQSTPPPSPFVRIAAGALLVSLLTALPWVGIFVQPVVVIVGLGALIVERIDAWRRMRAADEMTGASATGSPGRLGTQ